MGSNQKHFQPMVEIPIAWFDGLFEFAKDIYDEVDPAR